MVQARGSQGGDEKVTIIAKNAPLREVFKSITKQTGLYLFYSSEVVNVQEKVTLEAHEQTVNAVLAEVLDNKGLAWVYNGNAITIRVKGKEEKKRINLSDDSTTNPVQIVSGKVTDANGNPIPGATILVKRTRDGATTDPEGNFFLSGVRKNDKLQVSSIGFETREVQAQGNSMMVKLNVVVNDLDETVVIAYGTTTKRYNTGNISTVKADEIEKQPVSNPLLALQGRVPGLFITQSSGVPGSGITVRVEGQNSIQKGNDPLYVIDGVPYISQLLPSQNGILGSSGDAIYGANGNPMNFINPADIESIDVLKDADATAIYGSRAANGAILITTKKGMNGGTKLDLNIQSGWGKVTNTLDLMNASQYLKLRHEALLLDGKLEPGYDDYDINGTWDTTRNTNWQKELIGGVATYTDVQTSFSGGGDNTQFLLGAGYHKETTVFPGDFFDKKGSLHFNVSHSSSDKKVSCKFSANYQSDDNRLMQDQLISKAILLSPVTPDPYNSDGTLNWALSSDGNNTWDNPYALLYRRFNSKVNNLISNAIISYRLPLNIELKGSFGYTNLQQNDFNSTPQSYYSPTLWAILGNSLRTANYTDNNIETWIIEPQLAFHQDIKRGKLNVLIGSTLSCMNSKGETIIGSGYNSDQSLEDIKAAADVTVSNTIHSIYRYNALFGRLNYNLEDKYIISLNARRDGSSRFGRENRFHNFGSMAIGWIFSNEKIVKKGFSFLSFGKVRGSYGSTGSDQIGDYQYLNQYVPVNVGMPYLNTGGLNANGLVNPYIQWEETRKLQLGLDLGFINDRVYINTTFFKNKSSNQLLGYILPATTGFNTITMNFPATVKNSGWEISMTTINLKLKNFTWSTNANITIPRNQLSKFPNLEISSYADRLIIGQSLSIRKLYNLNGVDSKTGLYEYKTGDGKITTDPNYDLDRTAIINTSPKYYGGIENTLIYKGFQLSTLFQFVSQVGSNYYLGNYPGTFNYNQPTYLLDRWTSEGSLSTHQRPNADFRYFLQFFNASLNSNATYSDASFIRLKNISFSWDLPAHLCYLAHIEKMRFFIRGQNMLTITKYKGIDPESQSVSALPPLKVMTFGIKVTFN